MSGGPGRAQLDEVLVHVLHLGGEGLRPLRPGRLVAEESAFTTMASTGSRSKRSISARAIRFDSSSRPECIDSAPQHP
jgi:hypothetical protein